MFDRVQDIIDFAIGKEQEAVDFYTDLAANVESPVVAEELRKMAAEEVRHRDRLRNAPIAFVGDPESSGKVVDLKIADFTLLPKVTPDMSFQDAINIAMHREKDAMDFYSTLANVVTDQTTKEVFTNLAGEEARHKLYFETLWDERVMQED